jgi:hypothetical protein
MFYTPVTLAKTIGLTVFTVYRHIKEGLPADKGILPYLIYGREAKVFYRNWYTINRKELLPGETRCLFCGRTFVLLDCVEKTIFTGRFYHKGKMQIQHTVCCPYDQKRFSRFASYITTVEVDKGAEVPMVLLTGECKK